MDYLNSTINMNNSILVNTLLKVSEDVTKANEFQYIVPETFLYIMLNESRISNELSDIIKINEMNNDLVSYLITIPKNTYVGNSDYMNETIKLAITFATKKSHKSLMISDIIDAMFDLTDSYVQMLLDDYKTNKLEILNCLDKAEGIISKTQNVDFNQVPFKFNNTNDSSQKAVANNATKSNKMTNNLITCLNGTIQHPIIGRKHELERTIQILARATKNNPIHVGEPGVGKTAIVEGLVQMIDDGNVPDILKDAKVYSLTVGDLMAGTQFRGDLEGRIKKILTSLEKENNVILYIDEIHNIVGAGGSSNGGADISNLLKPYLTTGKIKFIGATTEEEYKKIFSKDKALSRRFQKVTVAEPTIDETIQILEGLKEYYENFHEVVYKDEALKAAVELSTKYVNDRFLPDKAIDLIDEAGAYLNTYGNKKVVDKSLIEDVLSKTCNIPKVTVETDEIAKLKVLDKSIKADLYGQDQAVDEIVKAIKISRAGLLDDNKPIASLLMVGPTGVGKTELAKTLAKTLGIGFVKFDMSEYMDKTSVNKLIGASSGYVGYEEGGMLVDAIRKQPHCVLLLDEIEKAHSDVFNILLQVMDDAVLTDNQGRKADFKNVIILMTSNAGAADVGKVSIGFETQDINMDAMSEAVNKTFTPEFRNRLSGTVVFNAMDKNMATLIAKKQLRVLESKMPQISIKYETSVMDYIVEKGLKDKQYGGRAIKRVIENELKPLFVDELLFGKLKNGGSCKVEMKNEKFHLACRAPFKKAKAKVSAKAV